VQVMDSAAGAIELSASERKLIGVIQKQDRLLYLCFYLLLNLAENVSVERKMKKKNIVQHLLCMMDRSNVELLILAVTFLKKLSIYRENKEQMVKVLGCP
jgi:Kinesin-associated protein (KAP)